MIADGSGAGKGIIICYAPELVHLIVGWILQWNPSIRTPLKQGHLFNQDTVVGPSGI